MSSILIAIYRFLDHPADVKTKYKQKIKEEHSPFLFKDLCATI